MIAKGFQSGETEKSSRSWKTAPLTGRGAGTHPVTAVTPDKRAQDRGRVADLAGPGLRLDLVGLAGVEVAGVLVHVDPGGHARRVQLGVELGGVDVRADPERLYLARGRTGQQHRVRRQLADRLLVPGERVELRGQLAQHRVT